MRIRVQRLGNSLALRIPKMFAEQTGLHAGSVVCVSQADRKLIIHADPVEVLTLEQLLRDITDANLHGEWDTGPALGKERADRART